MLNQKPWRYAVPMRHPKTGETRTVVVELTADERMDAIRNIAHTGGDDGLIANGYAGRRAEATMPGFWSDGEIERVVLH
jgi:hypothetical protein